MHYLEQMIFLTMKHLLTVDCPMCKEGKPVEALVNGYGYSEI